MNINISSRVVVLLCLEVVIFSIYFSLIKDVYDFEGLNDFYKFYLSASESLRGYSPYWPAPNLEVGCLGSRQISDRMIHPGSSVHNVPVRIQDVIHPNLNPPAFVALIKPIALLGYKKAWVLYCFASLCFASISVLIVSKLLSGSLVINYFLLSIGLLSYFPSYANFEYGQVSFFLLLPTIVSWRLFGRGLEFFAGVFVGILAGLKPFYLMFALSYLAAKKYIAISFMLLGFLLTILLGGYFVGFSYYYDYLDVLSRVTWLASSWNASFSGFYSRIFGGAEGGSMYDWPYIADIAVAASSLVIVFFVFNRIKANAEEGLDQKMLADTIYSITIPAMLLVSPLGWLYYFPLLFLSLWIYFERVKSAANPRILVLLMVLGLSMSALPSFLTSSCASKSGGALFWQNSLPFYSLLMIFIMLVHISKNVGQKPYSAKNIL